MSIGLGSDSGLLLLDGPGIAAALQQMALQIHLHEPADSLAIVGVVARGDVLAGRLCGHMERLSGRRVDHGGIDITLYRDDLSRPSGAGAVVRPSALEFGLDDRTVVLVDDVLQTGRTVRAAMDALLALGRPRAIRLAVLVDRGGRELPIQPDYVGLSIDSPSRRVVLELSDRPPEGERVLLG